MQAQDTLRIFSDSELLVRQIEGRYAVKNKELRILHDRVKKILVPLHYSVHHVMRSLNSIADSLANYGIDKKITVPPEFAHHCHF